MSKPYTLKKEVGTDTLRCLNSGQPLAISLLWALQQEDSESFGKYVPSDETVEDWIAALKSGKKIVNPLSPKEELRSLYFGIEGLSDFHSGINQALKIIAKEHPDVKDWLKDNEGEAKG